MRFVTLVLSAVITLGSSPSKAEEAHPELSIQINAINQEATSCRLTFLVYNAMGMDLESAVFETVLFDTNGSVLTLTLFDFGALPQDRSRVRQFDLADIDCASVGGVLLNGAHACEGTGVDASACDAALALSTRTEVELLG